MRRPAVPDCWTIAVQAIENSGSKASIRDALIWPHGGTRGGDNMAKARSAPCRSRCLLTGWAWGAAAGAHVERLADGTVLLKLGPAYENAVIETSVDELGPLLGGASPALRRDDGACCSRTGRGPAWRHLGADRGARARSGKSSPAPGSSSAGPGQRALRPPDARSRPGRGQLRRGRRRRLLLRRPDRRQPYRPGRPAAGERQVPALELRFMPPALRHSTAGTVSATAC